MEPSGGRTDPASPKDWAILAAGLIQSSRYDEGIDAYRTSLELDPLQPAVWNNLGVALCSRRQVRAAIECFEHSLSLSSSFPAAFSNLLFTLNYNPSIAPEQVFARHKEWATIHACQPEKPLVCEKGRKTPDGPIRVGYVSGSFFEHSSFYSFEPILISHSRPEFQITCYSNSPGVDSATRRLEKASDRWRPIHDLTDQDATALIEADDIDILVDLSGHTEGNRLTLFGRKPTPVQVTWLGYPNTTGLAAIDYRLTCAVSDPPGETEHLHSENLIRLPQFICYQPPSDTPDVAPLPALTDGRITFGCFNNIPKITDAAVEAWAEILRAVPESLLLLKSRGYSSAWVREKMLARFAHRDVDPARVEMVEFVPTKNEHFALYNRVDIALDTWPYNGTLTTCEALWMGVPVVTLIGQVHAARVGLSLVAAVGLEQMAACSVAGYVSKAVELAGDLSGLDCLRKDMRSRLASSPLLDSRGLVRNMESAYREMLYAGFGGTRNSYA